VNDRNDRWFRLWEAATVEEGNPATIVPNPEDPMKVTLVYSDDCSVVIYWKNTVWNFSEEKP
jgi:hypothetical protein